MTSITVLLSAMRIARVPGHLPPGPNGNTVLQYLLYFGGLSKPGTTMRLPLR